jgi:hypothetical protein
MLQVNPQGTSYYGTVAEAVVVAAVDLMTGAETSETHIIKVESEVKSRISTNLLVLHVLLLSFCWVKADKEGGAMFLKTDARASE